MRAIGTRIKEATVLMIVLFLASCGGSDQDDPQVTPGDQDITITSISPEHPYMDETVTITGTGFNADTSKVKVEIGSSIGEFIRYYNSSNKNARIQVLTASTTEITFKVIDPRGYDALISHGNANKIRVTSDGHSALMDVTIKLFPDIDFGGVAGYSNSPLTPLVDYKVFARGITPDCSMDVSLGQCIGPVCFSGGYEQCSCEPSHVITGCVKPDDPNHFIFTIPQSFYGYTAEYCNNNPAPPHATFQALIQVVNADGKKSTPRYVWVNRCPQ